MEGALIAGFAAVVAIAAAAALAAARTSWPLARIIAASAAPGVVFGALVATGSGGGRAWSFVLIAAVMSATAGALGSYAGLGRRKIERM